MRLLRFGFFIGVDGVWGVWKEEGDEEDGEAEVFRKVEEGRRRLNEISPR